LAGWGGVCGVDPFGSGYRLVAGSCRYIDEPSGSDSMEVVTLSYYTFNKCTTFVKVI
jgi:hypothetical protein